MIYIRVISVACCVGVILAGCSREPPAKLQAAPSQQADSATTEWTGDADDPVAALSEEKLTEAIARARSTANDARQRWLAQRDSTTNDDPSKRQWAIKWPAPVFEAENRQVEYVWVRPLSWSRFRIEGILVSRPTDDIGYEYGDLVAFPAEQLADWISIAQGKNEGKREGGFTVEVLEMTYGTPPEN